MSTSRRTPHPVVAVAAGLAVALALALAGCGGKDSDKPTATPSHNQADVTFVRGMIPHHQQALEMVTMTEGRRLTPDFAHLTRHVHDAQQPEIETMRGWLTAWREDASHDSGHHMAGMDEDDMGEMGGDMSGDMSGGMGGMPGMVGPHQLDRLDGLEGARFEAAWLRLMIGHHEGAVEMARTEISDGRSREARDLAASIVESQTTEIAEMRAMLEPAA